MIREIACRQLAHPPVIMQAVAAYRMLTAGIGTITILSVSVFLAIHDKGFKFISGASPGQHFQFCTPIEGPALFRFIG